MALVADFTGTDLEVIEDNMVAGHHQMMREHLESLRDCYDTHTLSALALRVGVRFQLGIVAMHSDC